MIYYLLLFNFFILGTSDLIKEKRIRNYIFLVFITFLIIFAGIRWETGTDWKPYFEFFNNITDTKIYKFEVGYELLSNFISYITSYFNFLLLIISLITMFFVGKTLLKWSTYPLLSLLYFFSTYYINLNMGAMRQGIAIALIFFSASFLLNNNKKKFIILVLIATAFHYSAIIFLLAIFIPENRISRSSAIIIVVLCVLFGFYPVIQNLMLYFKDFSFLPAYIKEKLLYYGNDLIKNKSMDYSTHIMISYLRRFILLFIFFVFRPKLEKINPSYNFFLNLYFLSCCLYFLVYPTMTEMNRITMYFGIFEIVLVPLCIDISKDKNIKIILYLFFGLYCFLKLQLALKLFYNLYYPYYTIFDLTGNMIFR
jgi:hypothetical protein